MDTESVRKIIVDFDAVTNTYTQREATDDEMANWPEPFASTPFPKAPASDDVDALSTDAG